MYDLTHDSVNNTGSVSHLVSTRWIKSSYYELNIFTEYVAPAHPVRIPQRDEESVRHHFLVVAKKAQQKLLNKNGQ